uniref:Uncharacterized protein n=1 Tax=Rhizophora mucronata TaxID=61149 RepID=A0A2P2PVK1_RHIMU
MDLRLIFQIQIYKIDIVIKLFSYVIT